MKFYIKVMAILGALTIYNSNYSSELPGFIQKYHSSIPSLEYDSNKSFSPKDQASIIGNYLCKFIPQIKTLSLNGHDKLENKLEYLITNQKQIQLVILGFPFKSTNHEKKCLSSEADLGEYLGLTTLNQLVYNIKLLYPNTHCAIISDGLAYHINNYDPSYEEIHNYHARINDLTTHFKNVSFIPWKINNKLGSYQELQEAVAAVPLENEENSDQKRYQEMKAFASSEFKCTHWENFFLNKALNSYNERQQFEQKELKQKNKDQAIKTEKNTLIAENMKLIIPQLVYKGKQFSTLVSTQWPDYDECIRLSVHCDKNVVDVSTKIPINIIYGHSGTPWHNAIVIDNTDTQVKGFAKDIFKKNDLNLLAKSKKTFSLKTPAGILPLSYIAH